MAGAGQAIDLIDLRSHQGLHPHIGALDVCPVVWQTRGPPRRRDRGGARGRRGDRRARHPRLLLRRAGDAARSARERAYFRKGGPAELARRMKAGELEPDLGPVRAAPDRRRDPGHRPRAAGRLQRRARHARPRGRARGRRRASRGGRRPRRRPRARAARARRSAPRSRSTSTIRSRCRWPGWSPRSRGSPPSTAPGRSRPSSSGSSPAAALEGYPDDPPIRDFDPKRDVIENVLG